MTTRRTFLGSALFAASAATLPRLALGQTPGRTGRIRTKDGIELFVKDTGGPGRAIVLTHAWPLNADIWDYQATALSKAGYRVVTYDRRGFGRSDKPESGYRCDVFADDLAAGSKLIAYEGASHGIVVTERDRVVKDLQSFLGA